MKERKHLTIQKFGGINNEGTHVVYTGPGSFEDWKSKLNEEPEYHDGFVLRQYTLENHCERPKGNLEADIFLEIHEAELWDLQGRSDYFDAPVYTRDPKLLTRLALARKDFEIVRDLFCSVGKQELEKRKARGRRR